MVLRDVSFSVAAGHALILRGPNGIGKTTLLRTIAGLTPPEAGEVAAQPDSFAYGAHADGLKGQLTVRENLRFWAATFGSPARSVDDALDRFHLSALAHRRTADLSAGQKRRTGLARMLVTGRSVWLLDEPTVSLDADNVSRFAEALRGHLRMGGSALIATHIDLGLDGETFDLTPFAARTYSAADADPFAEAVE